MFYTPEHGWIGETVHVARQEPIVEFTSKPVVQNGTEYLSQAIDALTHAESEINVREYKITLGTIMHRLTEMKKVLDNQSNAPTLYRHG